MLYILTGANNSVFCSFSSLVYTLFTNLTRLMRKCHCLTVYYVAKSFVARHLIKHPGFSLLNKCINILLGISFIRCIKSKFLLIIMSKHAVLVLKHFNYCTTVKNEHRMYLCSLISVRAYKCLDTIIFLTQVKTKQKVYISTKQKVTSLIRNIKLLFSK